MKTAVLITVMFSAFACLPAFAGDLSCRATADGAAFQVSETTDVAAGAARSELCDKVYHIGGQSYELGGCSRRGLLPWPKQSSPLGYAHGRLPLTCQ